MPFATGIRKVFLPSLPLPPPHPYAMPKEESHFGDICVPTWRAKTVELTISMNFFEVALSSQFKQGTFITNSDLYKPLLHFSVHISCNFTNYNNSEVCSRLRTDKCSINTSTKPTPSVKKEIHKKEIHSFIALTMLLIKFMRKQVMKLS